MILKYKLVLEDFASYSYNTFDKELKSGLIVFFNSERKLKIFDAKSLILLFSEQKDEVFSISFIDGKIFLGNGKTILSIDIDNLCTRLIYKLEEASVCSVGVLSTEKVIITKQRVVDFSIVESENRIFNVKSDTTIYKWNELARLLFFENDSLYLQSFSSDNIICRNIVTDDEAYNIKLDNGSFGQRIIAQTENVFYLQRVISKPNLFNVLALEKQTGTIIWETENCHPYYCFDENTNKLFGLGGKQFEVINALTGHKEIIKDIAANVFVSSHLTSYDKGFLYFSSHLDTNIPVIGAINVESGSLELLQEIKIQDEKSFRIGLEKPIVVDGRLYVKDTLNSLHIFNVDI